MQPSTGADSHEGHFHFKLKFVFDRLERSFRRNDVCVMRCDCRILPAGICIGMKGFIASSCSFSFFQLGMILSSVAGTIETLFFGWELVGLSSALLVAFFHDRPGPVANGQRVWAVYRIADAAFLVAALTLHHLSGSGDFDGIAGQGRLATGQGRAGRTRRAAGGRTAVVCRRRKICAGAFFGMAAASDGRPHAQQCCLLRGLVCSSGRVSSAAS